MNAKTLIITALCALATAFALAASSVAATQPVDHFHHVFTDTGNVCGIAVDEAEIISGSLKITGSSVELNAYDIKDTWTNPANGKSVDYHAAVLNKDTIGSPTDNGDGTISIFFKAAGMEDVNANGALVFHASGQLTSVLTLDATTFDFVSFEVLSQGNQSPNVDFCPAVTAALT